MLLLFNETNAARPNVKSLHYLYCSWRWNARNSRRAQTAKKTSQIANNQFNTIHSFSAPLYSLFPPRQSIAKLKRCRWKARKVGKKCGAELMSTIKDLSLCIHSTAIQLARLRSSNPFSFITSTQRQKKRERAIINIRGHKNSFRM